MQWCAQFGLQGGGYAEYALTRPNQCVRLPADVSLVDGAIIEPLAVALHGVNLSGLKAGDKVLVLGAGPIGLAVAFWARRMGAGKVAVQDIADFQQDRALGMGADVFVVDPADPVGSAERGLGGKADVVFECVGIPGLIDQAVQQVRNRGTILLLGLCTRPDPINSFAMLEGSAPRHQRVLHRARIPGLARRARRGGDRAAAAGDRHDRARRHAGGVRKPQAPHQPMQGADRALDPGGGDDRR